jgi:hypothetical protein
MSSHTDTEEIYLPAEMSGNQKKLVYGFGFLFIVFVLVTWVLVIVQGIANFSYMLIAAPMAVFLTTTILLLRWFKDGGVPENPDHLKYVTFANMLGMLLICIGIIAVMYAPLVTCPRLASPSNGLSGCAYSDTLPGDRCEFTCNCGYMFPSTTTTRTTRTETVYAEEGYGATMSLTCDSTGSWNGGAPTCEQAMCDALTGLTDGLTVAAADSSMAPCDAAVPADGGNVCVYACRSGSLSGSPYTVCKQTGEWSARDTPTCR